MIAGPVHPALRRRALHAAHPAPTYNQRGNLEPMVRELEALPLDCDMPFIDDGSPDGPCSILVRGA